MADAYGIDWGAIQTPNILGSYLQGQQVRQGNEDRQYERQRNVLADQRANEEFDLKKQAFADEHQKSQTEIALARGKTLSSVAQRLKSVPMGQRKAALGQAAPLFQASGIDPSTFTNLTEDQLSDQALDTFVGDIARELEVVNRGNGGYDVVDKATGASIRSVPGRSEPKQFGDFLYMEDGETPAQGGASTPPGADETWRSMIQRESGGRPGVLGPQTRYGQAQGMTQMLPATAQSMARKLGVPWRPELMTGTTPEAAAYQEKLGRAYYEEGLQRYNGDPAKAAMYYHGGPDEKLWGPKTRAYAAAVAPGNLEGGEGGDTLDGAPVIPGYRVLGRTKNDREWVQDGKGNLINSKTGDRKHDPTAPDEVTLPAGTGLTPMGNGFYKNRTGQVFAINKSGVPQRVAGPTDEQETAAVKMVTQTNNALGSIYKVQSQLGKTRVLSPAGQYSVNPKEFARLNALVKDLQIQMKEAYNLGALTGPDMQFIDAIVADPKTFRSELLKGTLNENLNAIAGALGSRYAQNARSFASMGGDPNGLDKIYISRKPSPKPAASPSQGWGKMTVR